MRVDRPERCGRGYESASCQLSAIGVMKQSQGADRLRPLRGTSLFLTILIVALWGGNAVAVSFSVDTLPPVAVAGIRFDMGTAFMLVYCYFGPAM